MNIELLEQYNIRFTKETFYGRLRRRSRGGGMAGFLDDLGTYIDGINEVLEKVDFFINGNTAPPIEMQEMEYAGFDWYAVSFDYELARIDSEESGGQYIQELPLQDFKEILLMWKEFIQN